MTIVEHRLMVNQLRVDMGVDERGDLGTHPVLLSEGDALKIVIDQTFKQRYVQLEIRGQCMVSGLGPKLFVVPNENQVLSVL